MRISVVSASTLLCALAGGCGGELRPTPLRDTDPDQLSGQSAPLTA